MVIEINPLSTKSIEAAIKQIEDYRNSLIDKCHELLERLVNEVGLPVVAVNVNKAKGDSNKEYTPIEEWDISDPNVEAIKLSIRGEQLVFIEFGAGRYYNGGPSIVGDSPHPKGMENGFWIGSWKAQPDYPRKYSNGQFDWWITPGGEISHGTESTAPVYKAAQEMKAEVVRIATEVFSKGR